MGLDPNDPTWDPGIACPNCAAVIFDTVTPKYVLATMTSIEKCPVSIGDPPNSSFILTQNPVLPCTWSYAVAGLNIDWILGAANSIFRAFDGLTFWFLQDAPFTCVDAFVNQLACSPMISRGHLGQAKVFWGPQIGKEPIS